MCVLKLDLFTPLTGGLVRMVMGRWKTTGDLKSRSRKTTATTETTKRMGTKIMTISTTKTYESE